MALFDRKMREDPRIEANCHRIVHHIGSAALARYEGNVAKAFAEGSASCWSGYYHGILERAFYGKPANRLGQIARGLCDDSGIRRTQFLAYQCVHGLGHGLMIQTGYDLPKVLSLCEGLRTAWDQTSCDSGVFMENIATSTASPSAKSVASSRWLKDDDPVYPCTSRVVPERHKLYCYLMVTSRILETNGYDFRETAERCRGVPRKWVRTCFQSYGRDASSYSRRAAAATLRLCRIAGSYAEECIWGAVRDMTSNDAGGARAARVCRLAARGQRERCFRGIGTVLGSLAATPEERAAACRRITRPYAAACLAGAGGGPARRS